MSKSRIIYLFLLIICIGNISFAQKTNPFEIKNRKEAQFQNNGTIDDVKNSFEINNDFNKKQDGQINPFDIKKKNQAIKSNNIPLNSKNTKGKSGYKILKKTEYAGDSGFLLWIFLFVLIYIAILLSINRDLIKKIFKSIWYYNLTNVLLRNFISREYIFYIFLFINFIINFSIFIYLLLTKFSDLSGIYIFKIILLSVLLIYLFKHFIIFIFNRIFPTLKSLATYNFTVLLFNISLGILLIPLNLVIAYSFEFLTMIFIYFAILIIVIYYIIRLFRGFLITYNYFNVSIFHFFLYLCAFEILPLIVLYKIVVDIL